VTTATAPEKTSLIEIAQQATDLASWNDNHGKATEKGGGG
jgi:hypothetical protein